MFQQKKHKILAKVAISLLLLYAVLGFWVLPLVIKQSLPYVSERFLQGREIHVERLVVNPFALSLAIEGLNIQDLQQDTLLAFQSFRVNFQASSLFYRQWRFKQFELVGLTGHLTLEQDGRFNISDILSAFSKEPEASDEKKASDSDSLLPVWVEDLAIKNAALAFVDHTKEPSFSSLFGPVSLSIEDFSTLKNSQSPYRLLAESKDGILGKHLIWEGKIAVNPISSEGKLVVENLNLVPWASYFQSFFNAQVKQGLLGFSGQYQLSMGDKGLMLGLSKASVELSDFLLNTLEIAEPLLQIKRLRIDGAAVDYPKNRVQIDRVALSDSQIFARLQENGALQLLDALMPPVEKTEPPTAAKVSDAPALQLQVKNIVLKNNALQFSDQMLAKEAHWALTDINGSLANFSLQEGQRFPLQLAFKVNEDANFSSEGHVQLLPQVALELHTNLEHFPLASLQRYIEPYSFLQLDKGLLALDMQHKLVLQEPMQLQTTGSVTVSDFSSTLAGKKRKFLNFSELALDAIEFDLQKNALTLAEVKLSDLQQRLVKQADGTMNIAQVLKPVTSTSKEGGKKAPSEPMTVRIDALRFANGQLSFSDYGMSPVFLFELSQLTGSVKGLSSKAAKPAVVDLSGHLENHAKMRVTGDLNVLSSDLYTDILLDIKHLNMASFNAYSQRYLGKKIAKGRLNLDIHSSINKQKLDVDNHIFLDQFELGDAVKSEQATHLPVGLALALLKNPQGQIKIDLPIHGDLNDPGFRYGKVLLKTLGNVIVKAASSPFSLLAGLVNSHEDLSQFTFPPGSALLSEGAAEKAQQIQQALVRRPSLKLQVQGCYSPTIDAVALKKKLLTQQLNPEQEDWPDSTWLSVLGKAYQKQFSKAADFSVEGENLPVAKQQAQQLEQLWQALLAEQKLPADALLLLARKRQAAIYDSLSAGDEVAEERIFVAGFKVLPDTERVPACPLALQ